MEKICDGLEYQTDTHAINQKISSLSENIDSIRILEEPRENSYICCSVNHEKKFDKLMKLVSVLGKIVSTTSLPRLSTLHMEGIFLNFLHEIIFCTWLYFQIWSSSVFSRRKSIFKNLFLNIVTASILFFKFSDNYIVNLEVTATVRTVDYHGKPRTSGGDPITAQLHRKEATESVSVPVKIEDLDNGTYLVKFRPQTIGWYTIIILFAAFGFNMLKML